MRNVTVFLLASLFAFGCDAGDSDVQSMQAALSVGADNNECVDLLAGQTILTGSVCLSVDENDDLVVTYTTTGGWELQEAHLWVGTDLADMPQTNSGNPRIGLFPYTSGDITGATHWEVVVDLEKYDVDDSTCPADLLAAAHAALQLVDDDGVVIQTETGWADGYRVTKRGSWATYFGFTINCDEEPPTPEPPAECETMFALGDTCFLDIDEDGDGAGDFNRWGWTNEVSGSYNTPLHAGAGQCDLDNGILVGELQVTLSASDMTVCYVMDAGWVATETHLYAGEELLPRDGNGDYTVAPGQYPQQHDPADPTNDCFTVSADATWLVAHGVACTE